MTVPIMGGVIGALAGSIAAQNNMKEISKEEYPYEMYCMTCGHVEAYLDHWPESGSPIVAKGVINLDGTIPKPGDPMHCDCKPGMERVWSARKRT